MDASARAGVRGRCMRGSVDASARAGMRGRCDLQGSLDVGVVGSQAEDPRDEGRGAGLSSVMPSELSEQT